MVIQRPRGQSVAQYVLAIKRERRDSAPPDWLERVQNVPGVDVLGASAIRVTIEAEQTAIEELAEDIGSFCIIEPLISHHTL